MIILPLNFSMIWFLFAVTLLLLVALEIQCKKMSKKIKSVNKSIKEMQSLFDHHFKTTDKTIREERNEKKYWKNRALIAKKRS